MSFSVLITLTTAGGNTGPFNLYTDSDSYANPIQTGITKSALTSGYICNVVPDNATVIRVQSNNGTCSNYTDIGINGLPVTPTPTPTPTVTSAFGPTYLYKLGTGTTQGYDACLDYNPGANSTFFSSDAVLTNGSPLYTTAYPLANPAPNNYYSDGTNYWFCTAGTLVGQHICAPNPTPTPTVPLNTYSIKSGTTFSSSATSCATGIVAPNGVLYGIQGYTVPTVGTYLFTDTGLSVAFNGNNYYFEVLKNSIRYAVKIDGSGQILDVVTC